MVHSADLVVYFERAGFGYTSIISSSLLNIQWQFMQSTVHEVIMGYT